MVLWFLFIWLSGFGLMGSTQLISSFFVNIFPLSQKVPIYTYIGYVAQNFEPSSSSTHLYCKFFHNFVLHERFSMKIPILFPTSKILFYLKRYSHVSFCSLLLSVKSWVNFCIVLRSFHSFQFDLGQIFHKFLARRTEEVVKQSEVSSDASDWLLLQL